MTDNAFKALIEALETIPVSASVAWSPSTVGLYARHLSDLSDRVIARVIDDALSTCKFRPTIAELREMAAEYSEGVGWTAAEFDAAERSGGPGNGG